MKSNVAAVLISGLLTLAGCTKESFTNATSESPVPVSQKSSTSVMAVPETQTIPGNQSIPPGWIATWKSADNKYKTITKYDGLPTGYTLVILSGQTAPIGWAVTTSTSPGYLTITKIEGMSPGSNIVISSGWGVPLGWIVTNSSSSGYLTITRYDGLPSGTQLTIPNGWGVPIGWKIYSQLPRGKIIEKL
ncbi:hypothetical protein DBR43_08890 [Pedobacter sp. KBW06]|uniref:hypothetical protein n=1 Tax=Pedobacter sp. KBW06 TaxID=2153359 RepID=UPI000F5B7D15|nr:hypothetical protein [Pedobacter sp. KBW06]RQO75453.1 hypothetical protein DBR43_08890 [Pedobacter sp. KBW06]